MRKVGDGENKGKKKKDKIITFIMTTNIIASTLPKRRLTGTYQQFIETLMTYYIYSFLLLWHDTQLSPNGEGWQLWSNLY